MADISNIKGVHVASGPFAGGKDFDLFKDDKRVSIIFGRNGSGKSTIAREIARIAAGGAGGYFYDFQDQQMAPMRDPSRIRVFNEEYIASKVRVSEDGLAAFAMLGDQVDAAQEIERITRELEETESDIRGLEEEQGKLPDLAKLENDAKQAVKDGGWAQRFERVVAKI